MAMVWAWLNYGGSELLLALALADFADDDGGSIFPSVATLAKKTRQSERTVQRQLSKFRRAGWLILEAPGRVRGGRGCAAEYRISPEWLQSQGDNLSPFLGDMGDRRGRKPRQTRSKRVTGGARKGDTAVAPHPSDPSGTIKNHQPSPPTAKVAADSAARKVGKVTAPVSVADIDGKIVKLIDEKFPDDQIVTMLRMYGVTRDRITAVRGHMP